MKNTNSLHTSPEGLRPVSALVEPRREGQERPAELLELRTEAGPVYLRPTGWQRFWLQRAFRHFRVLPPQLLGARNQRRIASLLETSVVKPEKPVTSGEIFGVVAQVHARSGDEISRVNPVEKVSPAPVKSLALVVQKKETPVPPKPVTLTPVQPAAFVQDDGLWQWVVAGVAAAACIPLIMASVYGISTLSSTPVVSSQPISAPIQKPATAIPALVTPVAVPVPMIHKRRLPVAQPTLLDASSTAPAAAAPERFVSELPPGHFAHPDSIGSGEVRLKATIGADGSVKQVTVLSGDPRLAQAATRAVMRWHYTPDGAPMAAETEIKMRFFGTDGVSIASVAGPAS